MPNDKGRNGTRLDSWKEIAGYLRRDERTAIRWEKEKGLPVHRVPGGKRQAVFAFTEELDAWLIRAEVREIVPAGLLSDELVQGGRASVAQSAKSVDRQSLQLGPELVTLSSDAAINKKLPWIQRRSRVMYFGGGALLTVAVLALAAVGLRFGPHSHAAAARLPVGVEFTMTSLRALDDVGQRLWTHTFPGRLDESLSIDGHRLSDLARIADFRGDGEREVLALIPLRSDVDGLDPDRWEVDLFSSNGQMLWKYVPEARFQFGKHELDGPWAVVTDLVSSGEGKKQIWVSSGHTTWGNSFVVNLDPLTGKAALRFVNTGTVHSLREMITTKGRFLVVGGFNNEQDTGSLAVIDEAKPFAASPQSAGTRHKCVSCPEGDVDYYFVFPRSEINELEHIHEDAVTEVRVIGDEIEIRKAELNPHESPPQTIYLLKADPEVRVVSLRFESGYDMLHRQLQQEGKLRHTLEDCPERLHPRPIKMWTPAGGWTEIQLEPSRASE